MDNVKQNISENAPKVKKETKNKIRVEFDRTSGWKRFKLKYLQTNFVVSVIWKIARFLLLLGISYVILMPFFTKISSSFMSAQDFGDVTVKLVPRYPTLDTYKSIIKDNGYFEALFNTTLLSLMAAILQTFVCALIGYGFAKFKFKGNKLLFVFVILTMVVPHKTLQFAMFMKFTYFDFLGIFNPFRIMEFIPTVNMTNTFLPLAILSATGLGFKNGLYIFMLRQYFKGVPDELEESAYLDGYGPFKTFFKIILPLSVPMLITVFLFSFSWQWTDNFYTTVFFPSVNTTLMPSIVKVPPSLDTSLANNMFTAAVSNAAAMLIITPLIIIYLFCQRYMVEGIERSGITG
ncbi:MAG: carbohydrate ABC transporter permease [Ruminococcaceae bacterium]|nr:carbohydrate ABC transporter permease [Oscillospiraceae bacterium]